jgi:hypothetical protein
MFIYSNFLAISLAFLPPSLHSLLVFGMIKSMGYLSSIPNANSKGFTPMAKCFMEF